MSAITRSITHARAATLAAFGALTLLVAACGTGDSQPLTLISSGDGGGTGQGDDIYSDDADYTDTETAVDAGYDDVIPLGPVLSFDAVEPAVAFIVATGSYVDPAEGTLTGNWTGTGFFIDDQGTLVTNNHVATGAAFLEVYVNGEVEPRTARVLGQDECSDLAVLHVDGPMYAHLDFFTDPFDVGLRVYAAGFPLSDPEYTLTTGIIGKRDADGATNWTSVEEVVQHDARINGGNSGGPLVAEDGRVVGINYAGNVQTDQNFAITAVDAIPIIQHLTSGQDRESLGINGQAILLEDGTNGVFVQSTETGGPADRLSITAGDFILAIEDVPAAPDGTMAGYCKILRSKGSDQPLKIDVFRPSTGQVLRGTINTNDDLDAIGTAATASTDAVTSTDGSTVVDYNATQVRIPATMIDWELRTIVAGGRQMLVTVADNDAKRQTGFQQAPSAFDLDGILFVMPSAMDLTFWTHKVPFPVDLAFFGSNGSLVTTYRAAPPCPVEPCQTYRASASRYVLATPAGGTEHLTEGATLQLG